MITQDINQENDGAKCKVWKDGKEQELLPEYEDISFPVVPPMFIEDGIPAAYLSEKDWKDAYKISKKWKEKHNK